MTKKSELEPELEPPIPFHSGSNGEYLPRPISDRDRRAEELYFRLAEERAKRLGVSRRSFVESACGTALAMMVINQVYGCSSASSGLTDGGRDGGMNGGSDARSDAAGEDAGTDGGRYDVDADMTEDAGAACERLSGDEFIFDVQTHHVNPTGAWRQNGAGWEFFLGSLPQGACGEGDSVDCYDTKHYLREMFLNSDTSMAVLSAVPAAVGENPLEIEDAAATREVMNRLADSERLVIHGLVLPDEGMSQLDAMARLAQDIRISAWKVYTPFRGWRLDDPQIGIPFIERAIALGIKRICAHKGLPLFGFDRNFASPDDIGVVAAQFPDVQFIVYHSGYETDIREGPYNAMMPQGIDRLIKTMEDHQLAPNSNVWAELGSTWKNVMTRPAEAAHVLGKLLKYVGEDRVLWGTDSIWYGTPQDQIMTLRAFEITADLQAMYGYPALTRQIKAKIFGLNAAALYGVDVQAMRCKISEDDLSMLGSHLREERQTPTFRKFGPQNRREFFAYLRAHGGRPG